MPGGDDAVAEGGRVCVFKVLYFKVPRPVHVGEAQILPISTSEDDEVWGTEFQKDWLARWIDADNDASSLVVVPYDDHLGEPDADIAARAMATAALARVRLALEAEQGIHPLQLRFRVGDVRWIPKGSMGVSLDDRAAFAYDPGEDDPAIQRIQESRFLQVPLSPVTDVETRAARAIEWADRATVEPDPMIQLLHRFSALEAILGDQSDGLKAHALAIRRATLAFETVGMLRHPSRLFKLYDDVRSYAVHGEAVEDPLDLDEAKKFGWDTNEAIDQFLRFAHDRGFTKRKEVRAALDSSESRSRILKGLLEDNPKVWAKYAPSPMTFDEVLATLLGMVGKELVVSYSSGNATVFSFFSGVLLSGLDAADVEVFDRDRDPIELLFSNDVTITLDPTLFKHAELERNDNGEILKVTFGRAKVTFTAADFSE